MGLLRFLDGWKTILGYVLMTLPGLTDFPMIKSALEAVLAVPSKQNITNALVQLILAAGVADRIRKNLHKVFKSDPVA